MEPLLRVRGLTVWYEDAPVVWEVSFDLKEGEILGVVGESGSGKTTVIKAVMGLLGDAARAEGEIWYRDRELLGMPWKERRKLLGPEIGMVFQDCKAALCPIRTIEAQICESFSEHEKLSRAKACERAAQVMEKIGLKDTKRVLRSYPFELSGGMNQRVGICMAMMHRPALLLADEPTSALDVTVQKQVAEELLLLRRTYRTAMVVVTHNIGVAEKLADQVLVLRGGRAMEYGSRDQVLNHPRNAYTQALMDSVIRLRRL